MRRTIGVAVLLAVLGCREGVGPVKVENASVDLIEGDCNVYVFADCAVDLRALTGAETSLLQQMLWDLSNHWDPECQMIASDLGGRLQAGQVRAWDTIFYYPNGDWDWGDYHFGGQTQWTGQIHLWQPLARDADGIRNTWIHEGAHARFGAGEGPASQYGTADYYADHCKSQWA